MINLQKIGEKITESRIKNNLTQSELADKLYVTHQAVSKWENGKSIPSIEVLVSLTKLFNISIDYLLDDSEIDSNDFESMLSFLPRDIAFKDYINSASNNQIIDAFYKFNIEERQYILDLIISSNIKLDIKKIWPYLNKKERNYLLNVILTNKLDFNVTSIIHQLSQEETLLVRAHVIRGSYQYKISQYHYRVS
ncbi:hypothetical protein CI105_04560 [Candidatus Izimaplasma bacterium ZiA1]|uniref:helix-turn-helix domain-containing protein n=1 Tax=Candidatus Izimoplasma sp. ZiA1 TaxID=2024899 RepID=UPI000BAA8196|nr:hypothetical protein CI105_04560 [Candidatus Izimaplasma bacterium ZiA1]